MSDEFQVLRVKPKDLETALNETSRAGWEIYSIIPAQYSGSGFGFVFAARGSFDVTRYHLVFRRRI